MLRAPCSARIHAAYSAPRLELNSTTLTPSRADIFHHRNPYKEDTRRRRTRPLPKARRLPDRLSSSGGQKINSGFRVPRLSRMAGSSEVNENEAVHWGRASATVWLGRPIRSMTFTFLAPAEVAIHASERGNVPLHCSHSSSI